MLDAAAPGSPVFVAPDGGVYVDRDGTSATSIARWRATFDPVTKRRRARWTAVLLILTVAGIVAVGVLMGLGVVALGAAVLGTPAGLDQNAVVGAIGALVGLICGFAVVGGRSQRSVLPTIAPVPDEVVAAAPADAVAADVWRWATVDDREAAQRQRITFETWVERPTMLDEARVAAERYTADYRAYVDVAVELGLVVRPPAIDLDDPLHY